MSVFSAPSFDGHQHVAFHTDPASGLTAIIAVHNTSRGPAVGGCRMWAYESDRAALQDVLRLSRGMTYKSALAGLPFGGGKAVIIGDPKTQKTEELLAAMGRFVDSLGGMYVIAEDVGTTLQDMDVIATTTKHVACTSAGSGNPSPYTALGVYHGIRAAVTHQAAAAHQRHSNTRLDGVKVAIQGVGQVGYALAQHLHDDGAVLHVADISNENMTRAVDEFGATPVAPEAIYGADVEVFAPCAMGAIINDQTIPQLRATVIAGSANNQLADARHGAILRDKGILYAPDYLINAGGMIEIAYDTNKDAAIIEDHVARIYDSLSDLFRRADSAGLATNAVADEMAEAAFL